MLKERTQNRSYRFVNKAAKPTVKRWIWNFCSAKYLVLLQSLRIYFYSEGGRREAEKNQKTQIQVPSWSTDSAQPLPAASEADPANS